MKRHRRALIALAVVIAVIGACEWAEWPFLRTPLEQAVARNTQREISLGEDFGLRLIGGIRFRTDRIVIGPPPAERQPDHPSSSNALLRATDIRAALPYSTVFQLLRGNREALRIRALDVGDFEMTLLRDAGGKANWQFGAAKTDTAPLELPEFGRLVVRRGRLLLDDDPTQLKLQAEMRTLEGDTAVATEQKRGLELSASGSYRGAPLTAKLHSSGLVPLAASEAEAPPVPVQMNVRMGATQFSLEGQARDVAKFSDLQGKFRLASSSLAAVGDIAGLTFPNTPPFVMHGDLRKAGAVWSANVAELAMGTSRLNGSFNFDPTPAVPSFTGQLGGKRLSLPDLGPAFGGANPGATRKTRDTSSRVLPQREFDIPSLGRMNADVSIKLAELHLGTAALESLAPLEGRLLLKDRVLSIDDLLARSAGGEVRGRLEMDGRQPIPRWQADLKWSGIRLERFVKARNPTQAQARAGAPPTGYISGNLAGNAQLRGSGRSTAAMLASLDGSTRLWVTNGQLSHLLVELAGIDVAQGLGMFIRGDEQLPMRCAVTSLVVKDGRMTPEVGVIDTPDSTIVATGGISLAEERLALLLTVHPKDVSPLSLRAPVHVDGTFSKPEVRIDKSAIGMRVGIAAALAAITPLAGLLALIDLGEPEKAVCQEALQSVRDPKKPRQPVKQK